MKINVNVPLHEYEQKNNPIYQTTTTELNDHTHFKSVFESYNYKRKKQGYVYGKGHTGAFDEKHYLRPEDKDNKNKVFMHHELFRYMQICRNTQKHE